MIPFDQYWEKLIEYVEFLIYSMMKNLHAQPSEIMNMRASQARQYIEWQQRDDHDLRMIDKIDFFAAHGIDVTKPSVAGTTLYADFIRDKRKDRFNELEKQMKAKIDKKIELAPEIDKILIERRIKAQYGG